MYELECLRRRIEDKAAAALAKEQNEEEEEIEELDVEEAMRDVEKMQKLKICSHTRNVANGNGHVVLEDIVEDLDKEAEEEDDEFTGHSCLLVTWKTNPEVEKFKV